MPIVLMIWGVMIVVCWALQWKYTKPTMKDHDDGFLNVLLAIFVIPIITMVISMAIDRTFNKPVVTYACETFTVINKKQVVVSRSNKYGGDYAKTIYWVGPNKYNFVTISTSIGDFIPEVVGGKIKLDIRTKTDWDDTTYYYQGDSLNCLK